MTSVGDEYTLELRIRVVKIQEDTMLMTTGLGLKQFPVKTGTRVAFILRDISDQEIILSREQFEGLIGDNG